MVIGMGPVGTGTGTGTGGDEEVRGYDECGRMKVVACFFFLPVM